MIQDRPPEPGRKPALALTIIVHLALALALFLGVQWKTEHAAVEVELWSPTPRPATAPPPPEPPRPTAKPEPKPEAKPAKNPDIVVKKEEKKPEAPEKKKPVREPPRKPDFSELLQQEEAARQMTEVNEREARLQAQLGEMQLAAGLRAWGNKIGAKIRGNIVLPPNIEGNPEAVFEVNLLPTGEVIGEARLKRSSGNPALDAAIERAILKSSPLPPPDDPAVFMRVLEIKYRPYE